MTASKAALLDLTAKMQMNLRELQGQLVTLRSFLAAAPLPEDAQIRCERCGLVLRGPVSLADHIFVSHGGPLPAHTAAADEKAHQP